MATARLAVGDGDGDGDAMFGDVLELPLQLVRHIHQDAICETLWIFSCLIRFFMRNPLERDVCWTAVSAIEASSATLFSISLHHGIKQFPWHSQNN